MLSGMIVAAALAAQGTAQATAAPAAAAAPTAAAKPAKPEKPKLVCVEETQLGSLFTHRICATPEAWEKRRLRDAEAMSRPGSGPAGGQCSGAAC